MAPSQWSWDHFVQVQVRVQAFLFCDCWSSRLALPGRGDPSPGPFPGGAVVGVCSVTGELLAFWAQEHRTPFWALGRMARHTTDLPQVPSVLLLKNTKTECPHCIELALVMWGQPAKPKSPCLALQTATQEGSWTRHGFCPQGSMVSCRQRSG